MLVVAVVVVLFLWLLSVVLIVVVVVAAAVVVVVAIASLSLTLLFVLSDGLMPLLEEELAHEPRVRGGHLIIIITIAISMTAIIVIIMCIISSSIKIRKVSRSLGNYNFRKSEWRSPEAGGRARPA